MPAPACSVVIATHNRVDTLERCLQHLERSDLGAAALQVIVVDDGSTDDSFARTSARPHGFGELVVERQANAGPAAARNRALAYATAPVCLFVNDDTLVLPHTVSAHLETHRRQRDAMVLGTFEFVPDFANTPLGQMLTETPHLFPFPLLEDGDELSADLIATCNLSTPTAAAKAVRFDERFTFAAEDVDFGHRLQALGFGGRFCGAARAYHDHWVTIDGVKRTALLRGFGAARLCLKHGQFDTMLESARTALVDLDGLRALFDTAAERLSLALESVSNGQPPSAAAYRDLASVFKVGNVLGSLDEPTLRKLAQPDAKRH